MSAQSSNVEGLPRVETYQLPGEEAAASDAILLALVPEVTLSFIMSFLHGFNLAGRPAKACKAFSAASQSNALCQHVLDRDFGQEVLQEAAVQPLRASRESPTPVRCHLQLEDLRLREDCRNEHDGASFQLRSIVKALHQKHNKMPERTFVDIGHLAAAEGRPALLKWVAERCDLNHLDGDLSALMVAAAANHPRTTAAAATVCSLEQQRGGFGTALHQAAYMGAAAAVAELLHALACLHSRNLTYAQTPLHVACSRNHRDVVRLLLQAGSDPSLPDKHGLTAFSIASTMRSTEALVVLQQSQADGEGHR